MNEKFDLELLYKKIVNTNLKTGVKLTSVEKNELKKILNRQTLGLQGAFLNFPEKDEKFKKNYCFLQDKKGFENKQLNLKTHGNNLLIEGENYHALIALKQARVKVDVIYIDPPYNTGRKFIYNDAIVDKKDPYKHSKWLSFMKKRLIVAKDLLKNNGVIFVSIDDNEQAYLKVLMDEIFGEQNFAANIVWQSSFGGKNDTKLIPINTEYILCYSFEKQFQKVQNGKEKEFKFEDELFTKYGKFNKSPLCRSSLQYQKSLDFIIYIEKENEKLILKFDETKKTIAKIVPGSGKDSLSKRLIKREKRLKGNHNANDWRWYWSKSTILDAWKNNFITITYDKKKKEYKISQKIYERAKFNGKSKEIIECDNTKTLFRNLITNSKITSKIGNEEIKLILNNSDFPYPKPVILIKKLLEPLNKNAIVLDFFAGSATTGHAILELNQEDGGSRKFILINEKRDLEIKKNITEKIAYERLYRIIEGKSTKNKQIDWKFSKEQKSFANNSLRFLELKYVDKINGEFEEIEKSRIKSLYKTEFNHELTIVDVIDHD